MSWGRWGLGSGEGNRCEGTAAGPGGQGDWQSRLAATLHVTHGRAKDQGGQRGDSACSPAAMITLRCPCQAELAVPAPLLGPFERLLLRISYYFPVHLSCAPQAFFYAAMPTPWPFPSLRAADSGYCLSSNLRHLVIQHSVKFSCSQTYEHDPG